MDLTLVGYMSAVVIGTTLGLIGGGGSILTVPVLVYFFGIPPVLATAYSLFVVGISSLVGTIGYLKRGLLDIRTAIVFAVPSFVAVFLTRRFLIPALPNQLPLNPSFIEDIFFGITLLLGLVITTLMLRKHHLVNLNPSTKKIVLLMVPATTMVFFMRQYVIPAIPEILFHGEKFSLDKGSAIMILFALIMLFASISMIKGRKVTTNLLEEKKYDYPLILGEGLLVGTLTGIVGAGGGFLIIPALVLLAKLPMKYAVGTSLLIITIKSLIGFLGDLSQRELDWPFLLSFSALSLIGIFIGNQLSKSIDGEKLKKGFGYFVFAMAFVLLFKQFL